MKNVRRTVPSLQNGREEYLSIWNKVRYLLRDFRTANNCKLRLGRYQTVQNCPKIRVLLAPPVQTVQGFARCFGVPRIQSFWYEKSCTARWPTRRCNARNENLQRTCTGQQYWDPPQPPFAGGEKRCDANTRAKAVSAWKRPRGMTVLHAFK
eukprot:1496223-Rhodomonas_salina.1